MVVVVGGSIYWFGFGIHGGAQSAQAATRTTTASLQTMQKTVSGSGTLAPAVKDDVNFAASGAVTAVNVVAGSTVTAGQTLATLDTLTENANLTSAKATLATANATLSAAQTASDGSSAAVAKITADQAAVAVAQASVNSAQAAYNGTTLTSPIAGLVTAVNLVVGDVVTNGSSSGGSGSPSGGSGAASGSGTTFGGAGGGSSTSTSTTSTTAQFTVVGTNAWQVTVSIGATDLKNIALKQQVQLSTTENPSFFGTVASIGLLPSSTTGAATYPVVVDVTGSPTNLYDGVTVTAAVVYERRTNVLSVPSAAITTTNGTSTVNKVVNGKPVTTTVTVGEVVGNLSEITKGLADGDAISVPTFNPAGLGGAGGARTPGQGGFPGGAGGFPGGGGGFGGGAGGFGGGGAGRAGGGTNG